MAIAHIAIKPTNKARVRTATAHARYICREGRAEGHAQYLGREGDYGKRAAELEQVEHYNMPAWATERPLSFWEAADTYERSNGRVYNELELALPRELSVEERHDLARGFAEQELGEKYVYTMAFHNSQALDGGENPHVHIMFSERRLDGIEREPELFFRRYNGRDPENGGAKKERLYSRPQELEWVRERWARGVNRELERAGHENRIDHRSLERQGIDREPEPKMGPAVTQELKNGIERGRGAEVIELREYRGLEKEKDELEREIRQEMARVYDLKVERERRHVTLVPAQEETPEEQKERAERYREQEVERQRREPDYQRTVDRYMERVQVEAGVEYRWKESGGRAFLDRGNQIDVFSHDKLAYQSVVELAQEKGWETVLVKGGHEFRRDMWVELQLGGMKVTGYDPTEADKQRLLELEREREHELAREAHREQERLEVLTAKQAREWILERELPELKKELDKHWRDRKALGWERSLEAYPLDGKYPDALTKDRALAIANDDVGGKEFVEARKNAKELERRTGQQTERYERMVGSGIGAYFRSLGGEARKLHRELSAAIERYNVEANKYNRRLAELQSPENQKLINNRARELLQENEALQKKRAEVEKSFYDIARQIRERQDLARELEALNKSQKLEFSRTRERGLRPVNEREFELEIKKARELKQQLSRGRGLGL